MKRAHPRDLRDRNVFITRGCERHRACPRGPLRDGGAQLHLTDVDAVMLDEAAAELRGSGVRSRSSRLRTSPTTTLFARLGSRTSPAAPTSSPTTYGWEPARAWTTALELRDAATTEVDRLVAGPDADGWTPRERLLLEVTDELHTRRDLCDAS